MFLNTLLSTQTKHKRKRIVKDISKKDVKEEEWEERPNSLKDRVEMTITYGNRFHTENYYYRCKATCNGTIRVIGHNLWGSREPQRSCWLSAERVRDVRPRRCKQTIIIRVNVWIKFLYSETGSDVFGNASSVCRRDHSQTGTYPSPTLQPLHKHSSLHLPSRLLMFIRPKITSSFCM